MKRSIFIKAGVALVALSICAFGIFWYMSPELIGENENDENDMYDGPEMAAKYDFERTVDPATGTVPTDRLLVAIDKTSESKTADAKARRIQIPPEEIGTKLVQADVTGVKDTPVNRKTDQAASKTIKVDPVPVAPAAPSALTWIERGPNSDSVGPSNGNTRNNNGITSGRIRAIKVDANDATGKTVFIGGVDGGLWKTTDITASPATWTPVNDSLSNLAIAEITQDPTNPQTMYFATGESFYNADAVRGVGVFKSTDGGTTWALLASTTGFVNGTRIVCDAAGNIYLGTRGSGLRRSTDGGTTWTTITPTGLPSDICDLEISSTGRLHVVTGIFSTQGYRFTDSPSTVTSATWTAPTTPFPSFAMRAEISSSGSTLYALPANASYQVPTIYKSTDGGANWAATTTQPGGGTWASQQGWYALSAAVNPLNPNEVIIGGLDTYRSLDGGATWAEISVWIGSTFQYVHADQHKLVWYPDGNTILFGCDGGIHYSSDKGTTIRDRNAGLRLKQFYSVAMLPTAGSNYFLAGAQDNGTHQLSNAGLSSSVEVTGGDGAFVDIDQDQPQYQFGAYVYNQYRRSTNSGATWSSVNFSSSAGQFINPFDYDDTANIIYCGDVAGAYRRWTNPQTGSTSAVITVSNMPGSVTAVTASPNTSNKVFLGTGSSQVIRIDGADTFATGTAGVSITPPLASGVVSNIAVGGTDNNLMAIYSNYGVTNIWASTDGGTSWVASDGNLPDMPVRWALYSPFGTQVYIATETGVWETNALAGAATVWTANATFPNVRTDMIRMRTSDGTIAAATHGRGVWTATLPPTAANVSISGRVMTSEGRGVRNAYVTITDSHNVTRQVMTGAFGTYQIDDVQAGETYIVGVRSRRFSFQPRTINVTDNLTGVDFTGDSYSNIKQNDLATVVAKPLSKGR